MFSWVEKISKNIKDLSGTVDKYKSDSIIQSLPSVAYVNKAKKLINEKRIDEAEAVLLKALDISVQDARIYKFLGKIYEQKLKFDDAVNYYKQSANLSPQDKEIWLRLGMSQLGANLLNDALISFEKADKVCPFNTDVFTGWGMTLMKLKKYALARDKFVTASKISKYNFTAILLSAVMEIKLNDYESAEMKLSFLAKVAPNEGSLYEYAHLKLLKSDYDAAIKYAKKTLEVNKQMLPAYIILGEVYSILKDIENTEKTFNKALECGLDDSLLHLEWGKAYVRFFEFEKAKEQFLTACEQKEDYIDAKIGLALINSYNEDFNLLNELEERHGDNVYIQESIGLKLMSQGKMEDAVERFKKALRIDDKQTYNFYNLVQCYMTLGDNYKIREYFDKFILANSEYVQGFIDYAKWLISVNDFEDAHRKLRRAEKVTNTNLDVLNLMFFTSYTLVKNNICEYNIKEAISIAQKAQDLGRFDFENERLELENILKNIQGSN